jgi:hypothetical protein
MKYGQFIEPEVFLNKEIKIFKKPTIDQLFRSHQTTEIISFQLKHSETVPYNFHVWVVIDGLEAEKRNRQIWLIKGIITSSVPKLAENHRYYFEGRLDYFKEQPPSFIKIVG